MEANIEGLKEAVDLADYVERFCNIHIDKRSQNVAFAKCVFHDEDTASLAFYPNRYKCFGCGESGDIIDFVMKTKNLGFREACLEIAGNIGYNLAFEPPNPKLEEYRGQMIEHARRYYKNLQANADALDYLFNTRHVSQEIIDNFMLGLADNNEYKFRQDIGNISSKIVFPIFENRTKASILGMAYRGKNNDKPKYVNDQNNEFFIKGSNLYGMFQARESISSSGYCIIVEGYFDVLSMHRAEFTNTVGIMGTSMTDMQAQMIAGRTKKAIIILDSDAAGQNGALACAKALMSKGVVVSICTLIDAHDPDELCVKCAFDKQKIGRAIKSSMKDAISYISDKITARYSEIVINERREALTQANEYAEAMIDPVQRELFKKTVRKILDI